MNTFQVGQEVYCIATGDWKKTKAHLPDAQYPIRGCIYTIREVYICPDLNIVGIRLKEVVNKPTVELRGLEMGWDAQEFRPVKKTDISELRKLLAPSPKIKEKA